MSYFTTKKGDKGQTQLNKDERVSKSCDEIKLIGCLDSLKAQNSKLKFLLGNTLTTFKLFESIIFANNYWVINSIVDFLQEINHILYLYMGTFWTREVIDYVGTVDDFLERITQYLPKINGFVTPDNMLSIEAEILRTKTRETETHSCINEPILKFLNRLSDAYFAIELILIDKITISLA